MLPKPLFYLFFAKFKAKNFDYIIVNNIFTSA